MFPSKKQKHTNFDMFLFYFHAKIFSNISFDFSLTHRLFKSVLFHFQIFDDVPYLFV